MAPSHQPKGPAPAAASENGSWTSAVSAPTANRSLKMLQPLPRTSSREREGVACIALLEHRDRDAERPATREHEARGRPGRRSRTATPRAVSSETQTSLPSRGEDWTSTSATEASASPSRWRPRTISTRPPCSSEIPATASTSASSRPAWLSPASSRAPRRGASAEHERAQQHRAAEEALVQRPGLFQHRVRVQLDAADRAGDGDLAHVGAIGASLYDLERPT